MKSSSFPRRFSVLLFPFLAASAAPLEAEEARWAPQAVIQEVEGTSKFFRSGTPLQMNKGLELEPGDRIETASDGLVAIQFPHEKVRVKLAGKTTLGLPPDKGIPVFLSEGLMWGEKSAGGPLFQIQTPVLAAAVRGTEFFVKVEGPDEVLVLTRSGTVEVTFEERSYSVGPMSLGFFKKGEGSRVSPVNEAVVNDWAAYFETGREWKLGG